MVLDIPLCSEARLWLTSYPADTPVSQIYQECQEPGWLLWIITRVLDSNREDLCQNGWFGDEEALFSLGIADQGQQLFLRWEKMGTMAAALGMPHDDQTRAHLLDLIRTTFPLDQLLEWIRGSLPSPRV